MQSYCNHCHRQSALACQSRSCYEVRMLISRSGQQHPTANRGCYRPTSVDLFQSVQYLLDTRVVQLIWRVMRLYLFPAGFGRVREIVCSMVWLGLVSAPLGLPALLCDEQPYRAICSPCVGFAPGFCYQLRCVDVLVTDRVVYWVHDLDCTVLDTVSPWGILAHLSNRLVPSPRRGHILDICSSFVVLLNILFPPHLLHHLLALLKTSTPRVTYPIKTTP